MRILLTGGSGQIGFELQRALALFGEILAPTRQQLDLGDSTAVGDYLQIHQPNLIVNAAAYTSVDKAESEPKQAHRLNAELPAQLAAYAKAKDVLLVHYSSDYVYPGTGNEALSEDALTRPLSVYGQTKLEGDESIIMSGCRHLIFRTSWVYSARGNNFMKTILRLAKERTNLKIVSDQIGAPTPARLIADVTAHAIAKAGINMPHRGCETLAAGVYHLATKGTVNWHSFARAIFKLALKHGMQLALEPKHVTPISTSEYLSAAQRPLNSRLNTDKLEQVLGLRLPCWQSQLILTFKEVLV
jgi:dTDP-4-dehydrorhamnose reductase